MRGLVAMQLSIHLLVDSQLVLAQADIQATKIEFHGKNYLGGRPKFHPSIAVGNYQNQLMN